MSDDYKCWRAQAETAAEKSGTTLPDEHILETMYEDGCEPEKASDPQTLSRYIRAPQTRHQSRNDVSHILAEHRRTEP